jgi:hypothetical protein
LGTGSGRGSAAAGVATNPPSTNDTAAADAAPLLQAIIALLLEAFDTPK